MRILFSSLAAFGHTYPVIPLAVAARRAGHEVAFATGTKFHATLSELDLTPLPAGIDPIEAFGFDPANYDPATMDEQQVYRLKARAFGSTVPRRFVEDIGDILRSEPGFDLVVHEAGNPGAGLAARLAGIPALCHGYGVAGFDAGIGEHVIELATELGLPAPEAGSEEPAHVLGHPYVDICPPSLQTLEYRAIRRRIELRPVPFGDNGELPSVVTQHERPLVYLTLGTAFGTAPVLRTAIEGLASLDVCVFVTTGGPVEVAELGTLPDNVTVVPWVPQARVWEHVDLVVHHGGAGTTFNALGAGVKQLLLPQGADQFRNAGAVASAGVGSTISPEDFTADAVAAGARRLMTDHGTDGPVSALAKEVADMIGPDELAARLPSFAF